MPTRILMRKTMQTLLPVIVALLIAGCMPDSHAVRSDAPAQQDNQHDQSGDLLIINAKIWTADPKNPSAGAMLIRDGRFHYVGDESTARAMAAPGARTIDAGGRRVLPGLIDSHLHLIDGGMQLSRLNLRDVPDRAAFIEAVRRRAAETPAGHWIQGGRWSTESWPDPAQPRKEWIDAVTPNHPVLLSRMDGHAALANSVALDKAGIDRHGPPDPSGGQIERDPGSGEPTGILKDAAVELVRNQIPKPTDAELDAGLAAAMKHANAHGITCVHTMSEYRHLSAFDRAREKGTLTLRIRHYVSEDDWIAFLPLTMKHSNDNQVQVVGFKTYSDGSLGSRTAWMSDPYSDNPPDKADWRGLSRFGPREWNQLARACRDVMQQEYAPAIHAIGDAAIAKMMLIYESFGDNCTLYAVGHVRNSSEPTDAPRVLFEERRRRPRIEHAQHLTPELIRSFAESGVIASMQPLHKADDARYAEKALGPERCKTSYAFRSLLDAGATVCFGSDWPVVSLDPFLGVRSAATGLSLDGKVFVPEQNITVEEALTCYTRSAARAAGDDAALGMIREGYLADFVILNVDLLAIDPANIGEFHGETYVAGRRVYPVNSSN